MILDIPVEFMNISYDTRRHPQSAEFDFNKGANCQLYAYALLKHFGVTVPPFRSSQLWADKEHTQVVYDLRPLDLLLFNDTNNSWGAHVAVYIGEEMVIHLAKDIGLPDISPLRKILLNPKYKVFIGAKRIKNS